MIFWGNIWNSSKWSPFGTLPELRNFSPLPPTTTHKLSIVLYISHIFHQIWKLTYLQWDIFSQLFLVGNVVQKNPKLPTGLELWYPEIQGGNASQICATDESNFPNISVYQNISKYQHPQVWYEWRDNSFWTLLVNILSRRCINHVGLLNCYHFNGMFFRRKYYHNLDISRSCPDKTVGHDLDFRPTVLSHSSNIPSRCSAGLRLHGCRQGRHHQQVWPEIDLQPDRQAGDREGARRDGQRGSRSHQLHPDADPVRQQDVRPGWRGWGRHRRLQDLRPGRSNWWRKVRWQCIPM